MFKLLGEEWAQVRQIFSEKEQRKEHGKVDYFIETAFRSNSRNQPQATKWVYNVAKNPALVGGIQLSTKQ